MSESIPLTSVADHLVVDISKGQVLVELCRFWFYILVIMQHRYYAASLTFKLKARRQLTRKLLVAFSSVAFCRYIPPPPRHHHHPTCLKTFKSTLFWFSREETIKIGSELATWNSCKCLLSQLSPICWEYFSLQCTWNKCILRWNNWDNPESVIEAGSRYRDCPHLQAWETQV